MANISPAIFLHHSFHERLEDNKRSGQDMLGTTKNPNYLGYLGHKHRRSRRPFMTQFLLRPPIYFPSDKVQL